METTLRYKVWLDDVRTMPPGYHRHVRTAAQAIELLESGHVGAISLDHDLGGEENGTGYDVAKWLEREAFLCMTGEGLGIEPPSISVHSDNSVGAANMRAAIVKAEEYWRKSTLRK